MRINIIYQFFQTEEEPGHSLTYYIAKKLAEKGDNVTVFCGETGYMRSLASPLPFWKRLLQKTKIGAVNVFRTYSYVGLHSGYMGRLLNYGTFCISSAIALLFTKKPDVAFISSPPLFSAFSSCFVCWIRQIPCVVEVRDLWPDSLVQMNMLSNRFLIAIMHWMEKFIYNHSQAIIVLTQGINDDLIKRGWDQKKIFFIHCGVDFDKIYPDHKAGQELRLKKNWINKNVIMYFGALGEANNLDVILRSAVNLKGRNDIVFVLVGDGIRKEKLKIDVAALKLNNLEILPAVSKTEARQFINSADICLVTLLDIPIFAGAIPTKLIDYMACGKPVLCGVKGEALNIVQTSNCGFTFDPNDDNTLSKFIMKIIDNKKDYTQLGFNGYEYAKQHFSIEAMQEKIENVLSNITKN